MITIAIDAMSGDAGPEVLVPAALDCLREGVRLILVGQEDVLRNVLNKHKVQENQQLLIHHAPEIVAMDELPSQALRLKKQSSMRVAINLVKQNEANACVSAGNTGALMATGRFVLKTLPGIDRPAICTILPSVRGHIHMLDLGANIDSKAEHLLQFAGMGSVMAAAVDNIKNPRVGLLNIGEEEIKGNEQVKQASALLEASQLNYIGYVEGDGIFLDDVDVVVCDGFVGNIALKTTEGVAKLIRHFMQQEFKRNWRSRFGALAAMPVLRALRKRIDPRRYNGASLLGLRGIVIKSHGGADTIAFANAIRIAILEVEKALPERISTLLEDLPTQRASL